MEGWPPIRVDYRMLRRAFQPLAIARGYTPAQKRRGGGLNPSLGKFGYAAKPRQILSYCGFAAGCGSVVDMGFGPMVRSVWEMMFPPPVNMPPLTLPLIG